ncbi:scm-like with four MBT domains protein 1 [Ruditapes philippinarum]|uniref:scm-like with four MBT domains protein 1 n=1 Tax=Ruditapes philippinarum TaxID=129788 RepID=UPI00295C1CD9|nr:scm-like with four MBT domains protein 1 [Ruditapes philippinarum]
MNPNNRQKALVNVPRTLRPKAVPVSPIKSPLGNIVPQVAVPMMNPQGQGQVISRGNIVPQVFHGTSISQTMPTTQPRLTAQALFPQTGVITQMPLSQPRMATPYPQSGIVSQSLTGQQTRMNIQPLYQQTVSVSQSGLRAQPTITAQALYRHVGPLSQNRSATPQQIGAQIVYPQTVQIGSQMPSVQNRVSMVQNAGCVVQNSVSGVRSSLSVVQNKVAMVPNTASVVRNTVPVVHSNVPMIMSASPVFQNISFQPGGQLAYPSQMNAQGQPRPQFVYPDLMATKVPSSVLSPVISTATNPFQQKTFSVANQLSINQVFTQPLMQHNVVPRLVQMNPVQSMVQNQLLPTVAPEIQKDDGLNVTGETEGSILAKQDILDSDSKVKSGDQENESESVKMSEPTGLEPLAENVTEISEGSKTDSVTNEYTEMTLEDNLISDAQLGIRLFDKKVGIEETLLLSSEQNSPMVIDNATSDSRESSSMSNMVNTSDIEELLLFPSSFDTESSQNSQASLDFTNSNLKNTEELSEGGDQESRQDGLEQQHYTSVQDQTHSEDSVEPYLEIQPLTSDSEDSIEALIETDEDDVKDAEIPDHTTNNTVSDPEASNDALSQNISESGDQVFEPMDEGLEQNSRRKMEEVKDTESIHSNVEMKMDGSVMADTGSQPSSSEDSQDAATASDMYDIYTDDSNSITWENFHHTVLKLKATNIKDKAPVTFTSLKESSLDNTPSSCDIVSSEPTCTDVDADNETAQFKDDTAHEQSFEGEDEEPEFVWEDYLQQTGTTAVPPTAFKHVECSLQSGFIRGMKLEVPNKSDPSTFWVASVLMTCGPLLRLRYDGYGEESSGDFWCDLNTTDIHPIGWSAQNGKNLQPPDDIRDRVSDWRVFLLESLTGARTAPSYFFEKGTGCSPVDQLNCGMRLELQDILNPLHVWLVQILENVGGRLYLRLESTQSASKHFWMFYLDPRLHPVGWASEHGCVYKPPQDICDEQTDENWSEILQAALKECEEDGVPEDVFKDQQILKTHQFAVGMKLEALNPGMNTIGPATVTKVINKYYFIVEMDDVRIEHENIQICCNSEYLGIFPISWCQCKGIRLSPPIGWSGGDFVWGEYLSMCNAKAAPEKLFHSGTEDHEFERGMKLEAVNPNNHNQICAATITKIVGPLLWIHLDHMRDIPSHIEDIDSHNLFPVGWCESNNYQLKPPIKAKKRQRRMSERRTEEVYRSITSSQTKGAWCPTIYFNHRCFSGPYLSKGRISDLPKHVGPGPMDLVLREVLSLLVSIAYVPCRALKEIQQEGPFNPSMKAHILKAKYKGKKYKAVVEVCQTESQLEDFCRNTCIKLECCPYLFSPVQVRNNCPENCQQLTKTKSNPNYGKKRKFSNLISVRSSTYSDDRSREPKKRGRKKKRFLYIQKKGQGQRQYDANGDLLKDEGFIDYDDEDGMMTAERRRYDIQTRGAKLPKYSFEKKSHRKILMSQGAAHAEKHKQGLKRLIPKSWPVEVKNERPLVPREGSMKLESNPLNWSVNEVVQFLKTTDCSHLARIIKEQEVDGQAFLLMNLSAIQEHLELKLGPAVKLCHQIERLKLAFYENYA